MTAITIAWIPLGAWDGGGGDVLSAEERARAARFKSEPARRAFVACRVALRRILGDLMSVAPAEVRVRLAQGGKPYVVDGPMVSLSHSGAWGAVAVGADPLGIDVEEIRPIDDVDGIARFLAPSERARIGAAPDRGIALLRLWTVKESLLKGLGRGIADGLDGFSVQDGPWRAGVPIPVSGDAVAGWMVTPLDSPAGTVAALAWRGSAVPHLASGTWHWR